MNGFFFSFFSLPTLMLGRPQIQLELHSKTEWVRRRRGLGCCAAAVGRVVKAKKMVAA